MYDVRQFKPALYLMVVLGVTAFCVADERYSMLIGALLFIAINAGLVVSGLYRPLPRTVASIIVLGLGVWCGTEVAGGRPPIEPIALFLLGLIGVKLYDLRGNRDYGQVIVLTLLLAVAGAMSDPSTWPSLIVLAYAVVALYGCLLFHLKVETDSAREKLGLRDEATDEARLRQSQKRLGSSVRRLTLVVGLAAVVAAVITFIAFPRSEKQRRGRSFTAAQAVTGYSGDMGFQDIARITQNNEIVGYVEVLRNGQPIGPGEILYLRGNTMDRYVSTPDAPDRWTWKRSDIYNPVSIGLRPGASRIMPFEKPPADAVLEQRYQLEAAGVDLFIAMPGIYRVESQYELHTEVNRSDETVLLTRRPDVERRRYTVWSDGSLANPLGVPPEASEDAMRAMPTYEVLPVPMLAALRDRVELYRLDTAGEVDLAGLDVGERVALLQSRLGISWGGRFGQYELRNDAETIVRVMSNLYASHPPEAIAQEIQDFVQNPDVTGVDEDGVPLYQKRLATAGTTEWDETIARRIEQYLQGHFRYTMDLTDKRPGPRTDPMGWFVSQEGQEGHCEYFAGAMALACQSLGMPARVVVGFKVDEYNASIGRFVIRQSQAHAWVEVFTERGWVRFDPTSNIMAREAEREGSLWARFQEVLDYIEYTWTNHITNFDSERQGELKNDLADSMLTGENGEPLTVWQSIKRLTWDRLVAWLEQQNLYFYSAAVMAWAITIGVLIIVGSIGYFIFERWMLRRRLRRIGLGDLSASRARRLAKQLAFYDNMTRLLARHGHRRLASQTPREFARSLSTLPTAAFDAVASMTDVFYRVRYGGQVLPRDRRKQLDQTLHQLDAALDG